jgi:hypothetical protein
LIVSLDFIEFDKLNDWLFVCGLRPNENLQHFDLVVSDNSFFMMKAAACVHHHQPVGRYKFALSGGVGVLHAACAHVAYDLVIAMLVHPHDEAGLQPGVVDNAKPAEACVIWLSQRDAGMDATQLEWPLRPHLMAFGRDDTDPCDGWC